MVNKKHGGKRKGSGRPVTDPRIKKIPVNYRLPCWLVAWLRDQPGSDSLIIEQALRDKYKLDKTKFLLEML